VASLHTHQRFQPGLNTLDFVLNDFGVVSGIRIELAGTALPVSSVPEPGSLALLAGLGITGSLFALRQLRRRKKHIRTSHNCELNVSMEGELR